MKNEIALTPSTGGEIVFSVGGVGVRLYAGATTVSFYDSEMARLRDWLNERLGEGEAAKGPQPSERYERAAELIREAFDREHIGPPLAEILPVIFNDLNERLSRLEAK